MAFDIAGALDAGYTPQAIAEHLSQRLKFDSEGARKAGYSDEDIIQHLLQKDAPKDQAGFGSSFMEGAKQLLGGKQAAKFAYGSPEEQAAARAEMSKPSDRGSTSFSDVISGKGKFTDWASQIAGGSAGALAVPAAGSVAAGLMKGPGAAKLVGAGLMGAQYLVGDLDRQAEEQTAAIAKGEAPEQTSVGKAAVAAGFSTALDIVGMRFFSPVFKMFPVVGKLFGAEGDDAARVASTQLIEAYKKGSLTYAGGVAKGIAGGVAFEIPQEIAQTALERWQAGQPLTGEKAYSEYFESAAGALLLGGGLGIAKGGIKTAQDRALVQQAIEEKRAAEAPPEVAETPPNPNASPDPNAPPDPNAAAPVVPVTPVAPPGAAPAVAAAPVAPIPSFLNVGEDTNEPLQKIIEMGRQLLTENPKLSLKELTDAYTAKGLTPALRFVKEAMRLGPLTPPAAAPNAAAPAAPVTFTFQTKEEYEQELAHLNEVIGNPDTQYNHREHSRARLIKLTSEYQAFKEREVAEIAALDEVAAIKKGVENADGTGVPTGKLNDGAVAGGAGDLVSPNITTATPAETNNEVAAATYMGVANTTGATRTATDGKEAELAALEEKKAKAESAARVAAVVEAEIARAARIAADAKAKADAEEAARVAANTVVEGKIKKPISDAAPVIDIKTASANLFKTSRKLKNAEKAYYKADGALATNDPKLKQAREKLRAAEEEHRAALQTAADIAKGTTKKPTTTTPLSTGEFGQLVAPEKQLTKAEQRAADRAATRKQKDDAARIAKETNQEKLDFKTDKTEDSADAAADIQTASDNLFNGKIKSPDKHKKNKLFRPSLQSVVDAAEGITSEATDTEQRLANKELTRLYGNKVISREDINAARDYLHKVAERFARRTSIDGESHKKYIANRRAEAAVANEIHNITYGIDTTEKVTVPELEAELKKARQKTNADLKVAKAAADAAGISNTAQRRVDTSKDAGEVVTISEDERAKAEEAQEIRDYKERKAKEKAAADYAKKIGTGANTDKKVTRTPLVEETSPDEDVDPDTLRLSPSRAEEGAKGMDAADVQDAVDQIKASWKGAPPIVVVQSIKGLLAKEAMWLINNNKTKTPGVFFTTGPYKGTVYLIADNLPNEAAVYYTVVHEVIGHYGLRTVLGDKYDGVMNSAYFNSKIRREADRIRAENVYAEDENSMSKAESVEEALAELSEREDNRDDVFRGIIDRIIDAIRVFIRKHFGDNILKGMTDVEIRRLMYASRSLIKTGEGAGSGEVSSKSNMMSPTRTPVTHQAPPTVSRTTEQMAEGLAKIEAAKPGKKYKGGVGEAIKNLTTTFVGYNSLVKRYQNDRMAIKVLEQFMTDAGVLVSSGPNANNVFSRITNATGKAWYNVKLYTDHLIRDAQDAILAYSKKNNLSIDEAMNKLHLYVMALHEPERRRMKWLRKIPLNDVVVTDSKIVGIMGAGHKAADMRELVYKMLDEKKSKNSHLPKDLRAVVEYLAKNHADKNGFSENRANDPAKPMNIDINATEYNVIGQYLPSEIANLQAEYKQALADNPSLKALATAMKQLNENAIMLDKKANYWSEQVDNYKEFYAYENYVPFKSSNKVGDNDNNYSQSGGHETALVKSQLGFEGSIKDSDNPIEQLFADANAAAMRAGYVGVTESIKNAMGFNKTNTNGKPLGKQYIKGELVRVIPFEDRRAVLGKDNDEAWALKSPQNFFHYTTDGTIEVYKINDKAIQESIRREWEPSHPFIQAMNRLTSAVGSTHTRYNPSFAPMDFVRNSFFNAGIFSADFGLMKGIDYSSTVARMVSQNGLMKSWKVARLYEEGGPANMATLKQMAATDPFVGTLVEWLNAGGRISYVQGMTLRSQQESLRNEVGRSKVVRTAEQVNKWADMWANSFEFTSRAAAYAVAKGEYKAKNIAKGMSEKDAEASAIEQATAYAKNLANFEQIGDHGRLAGALFMFFRPAATGAVRALDSLLPAFQNTAAMIDNLPDAIKNDPEAVAAYRKEHQAKKKQAKHIMAAMVGAGMLYYFMAFIMAGEDDEGRNKVAIDNMAQWTRYARLPIPGTDTYIQIPWGFGLGAFAAFGAQVAGASIGKTGWGEMIANSIPIAMDSFIPIPVSRISPLDNPMAFVVDSIFPSIGRPFLEYTMNVDSMGRQIYNSKQTRFGDAYLSGDQVPEIYKDVARWIVNATAGSTLPLIPADVSPNTLYFFTNNYVDGLSRMFLNTPYNLGLVLAGQKDFDPKQDAFVLSSFIGKTANYDAKQFAATERKVRDMERKINMFKTDPAVYADYLDANPMAKTIVDVFNKQVAQLNKATAATKKLRLDNTLTPRERKAEVDDSKLNENVIRRNIVEMLKDYDVHP